MSELVWNAFYCGFHANGACVCIFRSWWNSISYMIPIEVRTIMFTGPTIMLADGATPPIFLTKTETAKTLSQLPAFFCCCSFHFQLESNRMSNYIYHYFLFVWPSFRNFIFCVGIWRWLAWLLLLLLSLLSGVNEIVSEKCRPSWDRHRTQTCKQFLKWFDHAANR